MSKPIIEDEMLAKLEEMAKPLELDRLVEQGVLKKAGSWYIVLNHREIPRNILSHATEMQQRENGEVRLKFVDASRVARSLLDKISEVE